MLHWTAWERGIKSLYYCRSKSISRAGFAGQLEKKDGGKIAVARRPTMKSASHVSEISAMSIRARLIGTGQGRPAQLHAAPMTSNRYPWAYDCWKRQQQTHWMGEEVPLGADIKDWQSGHLTDAEKSLLTQIFRFFTQSRRGSGRQLPQALHPHLPAAGSADDDGRLHQHGDGAYRRLCAAAQDPGHAPDRVRGLPRL